MQNKREKLIKNKDIKNNLLEIREDIGLTQEEFAECLGVSVKAYRNYEKKIKDKETDMVLPLDMAILISEKYNYTLDYIYGFEEKRFSKRASHFLVDIREIVRIVDAYSFSTIIAIPNSYWKYLKKEHEIFKSTKSEHERKIELSKLDGEYKYDNSIYHKLKIEGKEFGIGIELDRETFAYVNENITHYKKKKEEEREKILESVLMINEEENE